MTGPAFCTEVLPTFLGYPPSDLLMREIEELKGTGFYQRRVFFVRLMGFIEPTAARRIGLEDARRFEAVHERTYLCARFRAGARRAGGRGRAGGRDPARPLAPFSGTGAGRAPYLG